MGQMMLHSYRLECGTGRVFIAHLGKLLQRALSLPITPDVFEDRPCRLHWPRGCIGHLGRVVGSWITSHGEVSDISEPEIGIGQQAPDRIGGKR